MTWMYILVICVAVAIAVATILVSMMKPTNEANVELAEAQDDLHDLENLHDDVLKYLESKVTDSSLPEDEVSEFIEKLNQFLKEQNEG